MKKILLISAALLAVMSCQKYKYDTNFSAPTELNSPKSVNIDPTSTQNVVLSWTGGGAEDGGICLYNVLFDEVDGDFSEPIAVMASDNGGLAQLTLTHATLNILARNAGIGARETGSIKWTVTASRGGEVKQSEVSATISLTRPDGLSLIPEELYLYGSAIAGDGGEGRAFRKVSEGVFDMFAVLADGEIYFRNTTGDDAVNFYINSENKLADGEGTTTVTATDLNEEKNYIAERITVDFNTLSMKREKIGELHIVWSQTYGDVGPEEFGIKDPVYRFTYDGNGVFSRTIDVITVPYRHPAWPAGQTVADERYYFDVKVDDVDMRWRWSSPSLTGAAPEVNAPLSYYDIVEVTWASAGQWDNAYKFNASLLNAGSVTVKIYGNLDGYFCHQFE